MIHQWGVKSNINKHFPLVYLDRSYKHSHCKWNNRILLARWCSETSLVFEDLHSREQRPCLIAFQSSFPLFLLAFLVHIKMILAFTLVWSKFFKTFERSRVLKITWRIRYPSRARVRRRRAFRRHFPITVSLSHNRFREDILMEMGLWDSQTYIFNIGPFIRPAQNKRAQPNLSNISLNK